MVKKSSLEFKLRKIDETRNYALDGIKNNDLISEKYKKTCKYLNYVENLLVLSSAVAGCVSSSEFSLLVCVPIGITSFAVGTNICEITTGIKMHKSIIKKKKKTHNKIVLLEKQ